MTETALAGQSATVGDGTLTARMQAVTKALDDSGESVGSVLVEFIANATDLSELGRAIAAEGDSLRAEIGHLRAELARVDEERQQAVDALNQLSAGAP